MPNEPRRVAGTAHWWVDRAADLSDGRLRDERREQWHADVAGAREVGLPHRGLVVGMLLTAAFQRSARHGAPGPLLDRRTTSARSARLLVAAALLSILAAVVLQRTVFFVVSSTLQVRIGEGTEFVLGAVAPMVLVLVALTRVARGRRRGAAAVLAVVGSCLLAVGVVLGGPIWLVAASVGLAGLLGAWFVANRVRPRAWFAVAAPAVVLVVVELVALVARALVDASASARPVLWQAESMVTLVAPLAVAVVVAMVLPLPVRDRPTDDRRPVESEVAA